MTGQIVVITPEELELIVMRAVRKALSAAADEGMVSQTGSPLGPRRHAEAVKRRIATGAPGAAKVGRRYLLTQDALAEELSGLSRPLASSNDAGEDLRRELRAIGAKRVSNERNP